MGRTEPPPPALDYRSPADDRPGRREGYWFQLLAAVAGLACPAVLAVTTYLMAASLLGRQWLPCVAAACVPIVGAIWVWQKARGPVRRGFRDGFLAGTVLAVAMAVIGLTFLAGWDVTR